MLGVAQAERAKLREVAGKGRGHHPCWPLSQAHHSGGIIYDSDPVGIPLFGEAANPHPSKWGHPPRGTGTSGVYGAAQGKNVCFGGGRPDLYHSLDTFCMTFCKFIGLSGSLLSSELAGTDAVL